MELVSIPLVGLHHFYFAKLAQAASCKYRCTISVENFDTLSAFSFPGGKGDAKRKCGFSKFSLKFLAFACLLPAALGMHVKIEKPQGAQVKPFKQRTIMTHTVQTSIFNRNRLFANHYYLDLYQAVINTEDGDSFEYEVEADSFHDATEKAEQYAYSLGADITYIEVYHMS